MIAEGYQVLIEKGKWVEEDSLRSRVIFDSVLEKIRHLALNPDYGNYLQRAPINHVRRIHLNDNLVLYARVFQKARILTILAFTVVRKTRREEMSGEMDFSFEDYLIGHKEFRPDRFISLEPPEEKKVVVKKESPAPVLIQKPAFVIKPLFPGEALDLLMSCRGTAPKDSFAIDAWQKTLTAAPGDKILVSLPPDGDSWGKEKIVEKQRSISKTLAYFGRRYSVRFDKVARKFLLVPPEMVGVYCVKGAGRQPAVARAF